MRTCDAAGVTHVYVCGTTPYPSTPYDTRDPLVSGRNTRAIAKTALGAELTVQVEHFDETTAAIAAARSNGCTIYGLEQSPNGQNIYEVTLASPLALVVGNEVGGVSESVLTDCDHVVELPQRGAKESLNVSVATGIALYHIAFNL